jgi:hypothetical protein
MTCRRFLSYRRRRCDRMTANDAVDGPLSGAKPASASHYLNTIVSASVTQPSIHRGRCGSRLSEIWAGEMYVHSAASSARSEWPIASIRMSMSAMPARPRQSRPETAHVTENGSGEYQASIGDHCSVGLSAHVTGASLEDECSWPPVILRCAHVTPPGSFLLDLRSGRHATTLGRRSRRPE